MRTVLAVLFVLHGFAHGVGFAVPWKLVESVESMSGWASRGSVLPPGHHG